MGGREGEGLRQRAPSRAWRTAHYLVARPEKEAPRRVLAVAAVPYARQRPVACVDGQGVLQNEAARVHVAVAQAARAARVLAAVQHPAHEVLSLRSCSEHAKSGYCDPKPSRLFAE